MDVAADLIWRAGPRHSGLAYLDLLATGSRASGSPETTSCRRPATQTGRRCPRRFSHLCRPVQNRPDQVVTLPTPRQLAAPPTAESQQEKQESAADDADGGRHHLKAER